LDRVTKHVNLRTLDIKSKPKRRCHSMSAGWIA
jgi:hypothetical protein